MLAELPTWLTDAGTIAGVIIATAAVLGLVARARPVRWLWRQLVSDPIGGWAGGVVSAQVDPVRAELAELSTQLVNHMGAEEDLRAADIADRDRRQGEMDAWRDEIREEVKDLKSSVGEVHRRIDDALLRRHD